ncbi:MAG: histidinol-phosphate transaminase [Candidatus Omnitrophota bacterium]
MSSLIARNILNLTPYQAGKPIDEVKRELGLKEVIKLASNENPFVSEKVKTAIKQSLNQINRYPEGSCFYLKERLAQRLKLKPQNLLFGNGSDELIDIIIKTLVGIDEEVITAKTTFLEYEIITKVNGRKVKTVPLTNFKYDLEAIKDKINKKTKVIFIANPNNPTGTYLNAKEVERFLKGLPSHLIVVFDEAYNEFVDCADFPDTEKYLFSKNIIILRTFSKVYGLAGLRIGYALARPEFISFMEKARPPFNVNSLAQAGALAALADKNFIFKIRNLILKEKKYLYRALDGLRLDYIPSQANFILIDVKRDTVKIFKEMLKCGVIVRDMAQYGLNTYIRATIGKPSENKRFIEVLKKVVGHRS